MLIIFYGDRRKRYVRMKNHVMFSVEICAAKLAHLHYSLVPVSQLILIVQTQRSSTRGLGPCGMPILSSNIILRASTLPRSDMNREYSAELVASISKIPG